MSLPQTSVVDALRQSHCAACTGDTPPVPDGRLRDVLAGLPGWGVAGNAVEKTYRFRNYYETIAFVNAIAWIAHAEDHHPDLEVGYNKCKVRYSTHAIGGLSENDLICAAKVETLVRPQS